MLVFNIPIEPIESRYSIQWDTWFKNAFNLEFDEVYTVYGEKTSGVIQQGSFLDVIETNEYKTSQLQKIIKMLKLLPKEKEIILFFHDLWYPGICNLAYIRDGLGLLNMKICGCLHAGSYDNHDFLTRKGMKPWAFPLENSILTIADLVFVATNYHKRLISENFPGMQEKVIVSGFPIEEIPKEYVSYTKVFDGVFPHRLDEEKQPNLFFQLEKETGFRMGSTKQMTISRNEYLRMLGASKVSFSFALQETWGIAMQESVFCGCLPLVPDRLSYAEMYLEEFRYKDETDCLLKFKDFLENPGKYKPLLEIQRDKLIKAGSVAIKNIIKEIKNLYEK